MAVQIILNQAAKPAGVAGFAREDFDTGVNVDLSLAGGPFLSQLWSIVDKPIDIKLPAQSNAFIAAPTAATTQVQTVDRAGTYLIQVLVDQGFGLGARPEDIARTTFYAGPALNANPELLPRREPAYLERNEHNVQSDPIFGILGNKRGWSQEWLRWFAVIKKTVAMVSASPTAWGRVTLTGVSATLVAGSNIASVTRTGLGVVSVVFTTPLANANYAVIPVARGGTGGSAVASSETVNGFTLTRGNLFGALVDADFNFAVVGG